MGRQKSLCFTYFLWLFFGWFGLHHFYLGRDRQAFAWWSTFGGLFILGWIRDLWRIPEYVDDANEEQEYMETMTRKMRLRKYPTFSIVRFAGQLLVGYFYGILVKMALPVEVPEYVAGMLVCVGITAGVHLIGNIGREEGGFYLPFLGSLICYIVITLITGEEPSYMYCSVTTACVFNYLRKYRQKYTHSSFCKRVTILSVCMFIIFALWMSFFYFNAEITTEEGEKIKIRDSVSHFFKSPAWLEFKDTCWQLYDEVKKHGWKNIYNELVKAFDPKGEANARKVLGVTENSTEQEIKQIYKKLVRQWHPDKHRDNKEEAHKRFMEIQESYEILTSKKKSESIEDDDRTEF